MANTQVKKKSIYVLTSTEAGWDCVLGAGSTKELALAAFDEEGSFTVERIEERGSGYIFLETTALIML